MYPIRISRPIWSMTFSRPHICTELCNTEYELTTGLLRLTYTPTCLFPEKIEPMNVHISNHSSNLIYTDDIIPEIPKTVNIMINYPMMTEVVREVTFQNDEIKMSDVLKVFDEIYREIYEEEEKTASRRQYTIKKNCDTCDTAFYSSDNLTQHIQPITNTVNESNCNICFEEVGDFFKLYCGHIFHFGCIEKWYKTIKSDDTSLQELKFSNSCPNCRTPIIQCLRCRGMNYTTEDFYGVTPPYSIDYPLSRLLTDGTYKIFGHYYEELYFKGLIYEKKTNTFSLISQYKVDLNIIELDINSESVLNH